MMRRPRPSLPLIAAVAAALAGYAAPVAQAAGDPDRGEAVYRKRCLQCHGEDGDGLGPAAERLNPPPRDFTLGLYKFKSTAFDEMLPNDADLLRMIRDGMPGTAMPGWSDLLSEQEIADVLAYIKDFAGLEGSPESQVDYGAQIASSADSIAAGKRLFEDNDRCVECHGREGKGDGGKRLKDDYGDRTWPRNLTKPWTFRVSNNPTDIFTRISVGIPTTQMPSFADPRSNKVLTVEERWHVANYVASLAKIEEVVRPENTVVQAQHVTGDLPVSPDDPAWATAPSTTFLMVPQIVAGERFFTTTNDTITVRALYDDETIALHLEWDDRTQSIPGDVGAAALAEGELFVDAVEVQFPQALTATMEKPYFLMGDAVNPVTLWRWSSATADTPETAVTIDARGIADQKVRDGDSGLDATGSYRDGTWRVVMRRQLAGDDAGQSLGFEIGQLVPVAFFAWDGSNGETGTAHAMTTWYWLLLRPEENNRPLISAILAAVLSFGGLAWWGAGAARRTGAVPR